MAKIRITGGEWRSRLIQVADAEGLRPTPDRVRETLFNWLGQDLAGLSCLDLFAGSGILGIEAASRGAAHVTLVEKNRRAFEQLRCNAELFASSRLEPICCDALKFAPAAARRFDIVFLDPPYHKGWLGAVAPLLDGWTAPGARLYAEAEQRLERLGAWQVTKQGQAGQVFYHLLERD
ncbi:MAG: 16S rRNA (guanine(966)-N(2))-methyltransferase RsmD [Gammaproteobacteria bacterium]|nr:16S rRNA (guanine(966)-N(2))-methyltransferase RsmD [Gammaproteobacteria bacterium]MBU1972383.1 16S rRNA (guanine(966)-N(2))-methyltransferase RsmD [Gammaproteobacteria bacterium]